MAGVLCSPRGKTSTGSGESECTCARSARDSKEIVSNGLKLIRLRFSLGKGELPDLGVGQLKKYLLFNLGVGGSRPSCQFPRSQRGWDPEGFPILHRLGKRQRWNLAHSVASLSRNLPPGCSLHTPSCFGTWASKATPSSPPVSDPEYLTFCRKLVLKTFRFGWDNTYRSFCESFVPRASYRAERVLGSDWWSTFVSHREYLGSVLSGRCPSSLLYSYQPHLRYKEVMSAGKVRPLGIPSLEYDLLGPLHKTMYEYMSGKEWCLKGPPTPLRVGKVCVYPEQTSVDLVSATDGLRLDVTEVILGAVLSKAVSVPGWIRQLAFESLRPVVRGRSVTHGQMMGAYLSFPLLCLHSFCAASWAARGQKSKILVNGDDTLISSERVLGEYPSGYELNRAKTISSGAVAEINSTVFLREGSRWREVRNLRRGGAVSDFAGVRHMAAACASAGSEWIDAFIHSRIGRKWRFLPTQLDLPLSNHACWRRQRDMRRMFTPLPSPEAGRDDRWNVVREEPSYGEKFAFRRHLFESGRTRDPREWNPSKSVVLKTYSKRAPWRFFAYDRKWKRAPGAGGRVWFVSSLYEPTERVVPVTTFDTLNGLELLCPVWWN